MNKLIAHRCHAWAVHGWAIIVAVAVAVSVTAWATHAEDGTERDGGPSAGRVSWSDGEIIEGVISTTPGTTFQLVTVAAEGSSTGQLRTFALDRVAEIAFVPFTSGTAPAERMVRAFTLKPGTPPEPEFHGDPYPVRELGATVRFIDGEELFGVLRSCALYVKTAPSPEERRPGRLPPRPMTRKLLLSPRQEGKPGSTLEDLDYVTHIRLPTTDDAGPHRLALDLPAGAAGDGDTVRALVRESLESVPVTRDDAGLSVQGTLGDTILVAIHRADGSVDVGWPEPAAADENLRQLIAEAVAVQSDYYDERRLLGVIREGPSRALALVSLRRTGTDTNDALLAQRTGEAAADVRPSARAGVWMFRVDDAAGRVALVRRGTFVRQQMDIGAPTPEVRVAAGLWPIVRGKDRITVGSETEAAR